MGGDKIQEQLRTPSTFKMILQFERKYSTQGPGAPCHVSFGFFSGFYGIILQELQMDPQPESATQPNAWELLEKTSRLLKDQLEYLPASGCLKYS
jgi:hypothetical protein